VLSGENRKAVMEGSEEVRARIADGQATILGPVDCAMERLQNRWRRHVLLKLPPDASTDPIGLALAGFSVKGVQIVIDVDPYTLM
jgi:primosomal protein N' (replication factor Y)